MISIRFDTERVQDQYQLYLAKCLGFSSVADEPETGLAVVVVPPISVLFPSAWGYRS